MMASKVIKTLEIYGLLFLFLVVYTLVEEHINTNKSMMLYLKLKDGGEGNLPYNLLRHDIEFI
jgi:hypothetical protein